MAKKIDLLAARKVDALEAGFHADGGNLYLRVKDTGARSWVFRYKSGGKGKIEGKVRELGLGSKDDRSLKQARELAGLMREDVAAGRDPADRLAKRDPKVMTFADYAEELIESKLPSWRNVKHALQWRATLKQYAFPSIGKKLPADM